MNEWDREGSGNEGCELRECGETEGRGGGEGEKEKGEFLRVSWGLKTRGKGGRMGREGLRAGRAFWGLRRGFSRFKNKGEVG